MRRTSTKLLLEACKLSFEGNTDAEIAVVLKTSVSNVSRWRKKILWQEFEQELINAYKQSLIEVPPATLSEG